MGKTEKRRWTPLRVCQVAFVFLGGIGLAWLVVTTSAVQALPPHVAQRLDANDLSSLYRASAQQLADTRGLPGDETYRQLAEAAHRDPLGAEPFLYFGLRAIGRNDVKRGERLLLEARQRNPRLRLARLALLALFLRTGRIDEGASEAAALVRIAPRSESVLVPELARLAVDPETQNQVIAAFGADPLMGLVLNHLVQKGADPDLVLRLSARQPVARGGDVAPWQARLIEALVQRGDLERAHALWRRYSAIPDGARETVYDPRFEGLPGPPPFNWSYASGNLGAAERVSGPALEVDYFGRASGPLVEQTTVLTPGRYRLSLRAEGSATGQGSRLAWRVTCRGSERPILEIPVVQIDYTPKTLTGDFTIPASGCRAQRLQLVGIAAEFPTTQSVRISDLSLQRQGR
jgi:hypothetical protein